MKRSIILAERAAGLSLRLIAALNLIFVIAFVVALLIATSRADAQDDIACSGENLMAQMQRDDPALLERIRAEAEQVANGDALLWRVEKDDTEPSYLFGTMHMSDPRVVSLPSRAQAAFDEASTVVIETTDVLDQSKMMAAMLSDPGLMMFTDETTLFSLLSAQDRASVEAALASRGIPPASVAKMKPWMIAAMVALPACELARKTAGAPVLDLELANSAKAAGKDLAGLESVADQLGAMASLPMEFHLRGLVDTLALGDRVDDVIETMIVLYLDEKTGMFWPFLRAALPSQDEDDGGYAAFEETMVTARNRTMAERSGPFLDKGAAFVAVGALHLPGEDGLVALLRDAGYRVEAVE
ncbi:TraB/GumN family protein [Mesorhizobium sp. CAU 1741]|uniref:TraB/GumN family protein n=1 Tax=Mesorhizobium sp. CAU 1741 TaxID=3140366 RepID=UPI00325B2652